MIVASSFPQFKLDDSSIQFVNKFRYLGHIITQDQKDNDDIERRIRNMFIRTNILARKFGKCSRDVKVLLLKSRCSCFYNIALWKYHNIASVNKLKEWRITNVLKPFWIQSTL